MFHAPKAKKNPNTWDAPYMPPIIHNIAHKDEIWKAHIRDSDRLQSRWPDTWGFLSIEYKKISYATDEARKKVLADHVAKNPSDVVRLHELERQRAQCARNAHELEKLERWAREGTPPVGRSFWGTQLPPIVQPDGVKTKSSFVTPGVPLIRSKELGWRGTRVNLHQYERASDKHPIGDINKQLGWPKGGCYRDV
eukprot:scpid78830/ scgid10807/ 